MKSVKKTGLAVLVCSQIFSLASVTKIQANDEKKVLGNGVTDRLIIKLKDNSKSKVKDVVKDVDKATKDVTKESEVKEQLVKETNTGAQVIKTEKMNEKEQAQVIKKLEKDSNVKYVEPDTFVKTEQVDDEIIKEADRNDNVRRRQWHLDYSHIKDVWKEGYTGKGVTVGVNDSGYTEHSDIMNNFAGGYDFINDPSIALDNDGRDSVALDEGDAHYNEKGQFVPSSWHGTHVAGIIAASGKKENALTGVAFNSKFTAGRALGKGGGYTSDIADSFAWLGGLDVNGVPANPHPAKVINASLGSLPYEGIAPIPRVYQETFKKLKDNKVVVVVAAGNEHVDARRVSPANAKDVIVVGSHDSEGNRSYFSNWGPAVDVYAPGSDIYSSVNSGRTRRSSQANGYMSGTSMATPVVSGIVALMLEKNPDLTPAEIESILKETATDKYDPTTGTTMKIVNAKKAVDKVKAKDGETTPVNPKPTDPVTPVDPKPTPEKPPVVEENKVMDKIIDYYNNKGGEKTYGKLLKTVKNEDNSFKQVFEKGTIYYTEEYGAASLMNNCSITIYYNSNNGEETFGYPIEDVVDTGNGTITQKFINGYELEGYAVNTFDWYSLFNNLSFY